MKEKIENILKYILKHGIFLFDEKEIKEQAIIEGLQEKDSILFFSIQQDTEKRMGVKVLKEELIDAYKILKRGEEYYQVEDYEKCIKNYRRVLDTRTEIGTKGDIFALVKIGLCYKRLYDHTPTKENLKAAIDYLTVAKAFSKDLWMDLNFFQINMDLKRLVSEWERKYSTLDIAYFENQGDIRFYKEEIRNMLFKRISLEEACRTFGLNEEMTGILALLYAKEHYTKEEYEKGDLFFKLLDHNKEKSYLLICLENEVKKNKDSYSSKIQESKKMILKKD